MTRAEFLGTPEIIETAVVLLRQPVCLQHIADGVVLQRPGGPYGIKATRVAAAIWSTTMLVGSYDRSNPKRSLLTVHPLHRRNGLATEMVYQVSKLNPGVPLPSTRRTPALQRACEKAADRLEAEGFFA